MLQTESETIRAALEVRGFYATAWRVPGTEEYRVVGWLHARPKTPMKGDEALLSIAGKQPDISLLTIDQARTFLKHHCYGCGDPLTEIEIQTAGGLCNMCDAERRERDAAAQHLEEGAEVDGLAI